MTGFFQVLSRQNDINGNPYRLICRYGSDAFLEAIIQEHTSKPNTVNELTAKGFTEIPSIHLSKSEYRSWIIGYRHLLEER